MVNRSVRIRCWVGERGLLVREITPRCLPNMVCDPVALIVLPTTRISFPCRRSLSSSMPPKDAYTRHNHRKGLPLPLSEKIDNDRFLVEHMEEDDPTLHAG